MEYKKIGGNSHIANSNTVTGSFELLNGTAQTSQIIFSGSGQQGTIFTSGPNAVTWTRADIFSFAQPALTISGAAQEGQTLTASAVATNDSDATLHYQWQNSTDNFQNFTVVGSDSPTYLIQGDTGGQIRVVVSTSDLDNSQPPAQLTSAPITVTLVDDVTNPLPASIADCYTSHPSP